MRLYGQHVTKRARVDFSSAGPEDEADGRPVDLARAALTNMKWN